MVSLRDLQNGADNSHGTFELENVNRFDSGVSIDDRLGGHPVLVFGYRDVKRDSDLPNLSNFENRVLCIIWYDF
jgi:hypothetical protein